MSGQTQILKNSAIAEQTRGQPPICQRDSVDSLICICVSERFNHLWLITFFARFAEADGSYLSGQVQGGEDSSFWVARTPNFISSSKEDDKPAYHHRRER